MDKIQKIPLNGMNKDVELRYLPEGDYRDALNLKVGSTLDGNLGSGENFLGNEEVTEILSWDTVGEQWISYSIPLGNNTVIGSYSYRAEQSIFYFIHNSNDNHLILRYDAIENKIYKLIQSTLLNFNEDNLITSVGYQDRKLYWTDGYNEPRKINIDRIITKSVVYEHHINLAMIAPYMQLGVEVNIDNTINLSFANHTYYFTFRIVYKDGEKTVMAPLSQKIITSYATMEYITITNHFFENDNTKLLDEVDRVEYFYVSSNSQSPYLIRSLKPEDNQSFKFYADENVVSLSVEELDEAYSAVPLKSEALTIVGNRLLLGNNTEGYDRIEFDAEISTVQYKSATSKPCSTLKSLCDYQFAFLYLDEHNRYQVYTDEKLRLNTGYEVDIDPAVTITIPGVGSSSGPRRNDQPRVQVVEPERFNGIKVIGDLEITVNTPPPTWAKNTLLLVSENLSKSFWEEYLVKASHLKFFMYGDGRTETDNPGEATEIEIDFSDYPYFGYTFSAGDRIEFYWAHEHPMDLKIIKVENANKLICEWNELGIGLKISNGSGRVAYKITDPNIESRVCIYTPKTKGGLVKYYTCGKANFATIADSNKSVFTFSAYEENTDNYYRRSDFPIEYTQRRKTFNTEIIGSYQPKPGLDGSGTYEDHITSIYFRKEAMNPSDDYPIDQYNNYYKPYFYLDDEEEVRKETAIRISDLIIPGSRINGLSSFNGLNEKIMPIEMGDLNKLQIAGDIQAEGQVLLSIHDKDIASIYVNKAVLRDTTGEQLVSISEEILGSFNILRGGYGTVNPESVVEMNGKVFGFDALKGVVWRYSTDGVTAISDIGMKNHFNTEGTRLLSFGIDSRAFGGVDFHSDDYIICLKEKGGDDKSVVFNNRSKRWTTFLSWSPECMDSVNNKFVSFKDGKMYLHESGSVYNNFYGQQYDTQVDIVGNSEPSSIKIWEAISIESNSKWESPSITNLKGQESNLIQEDFEEIEGVYYASILKDINTPNIDPPQTPLIHGDEMRSHELVVKLTNSNITPVYLRLVNLRYFTSSGHKN